jgi:hypothetical protein
MTEIIDISLPAAGSPLVGDLNINSSSTVQPLALLRVGVFIPMRKANRVLLPDGGTKAPDRPIFRVDASSEFRQLNFARKEGFENVSITGASLNFETDFKVWCGIVRALNQYGYSTATIQLKFTEFAKLCGFTSKRLDKKLRARIDDSLIRLRGQTIAFSKPQRDKSYIGGLISSASYDYNLDIIELTADPKLWDLYTIDHQILLKLNVLSKLKRMETAQCLYAYFSSLPKDPAPLSFKRLRDRLGLTAGKVKEQNRTISKAINRLMDIGFLQGAVVEKDGERYLMIERRSQKLEISDGVV